MGQCLGITVKRVAPCRCFDGHVKEPYELSMVLEARPYIQLLLQSAYRGVARPLTMWKHKQAYRGSGGRPGPQWVQGKALVGGPGGRSPPAENGFQANGGPIRMHFWGCFGSSKAAFISEFTE